MRAPSFVIAALAILLGVLGGCATPPPAVDSADAPAAPATGRRVALVIGNAAYQSVEPLRNPANDAQAMAAALRQSGFEVILKTNATRQDMADALKQFDARIDPAGAALFYFAGHGMQAHGTNRLLPVDVTLDAENMVPLETASLGDVIGVLTARHPQLGIAILDACRDNPFPRVGMGKRSLRRRGSQGLAGVDVPRGTIVAYATAPGKTATDGDSEHGLYTQELLAAIATLGLNVNEVFERTRQAVARRSGDEQVPWFRSYFRGESRFTTLPPAPSGSAPPRAG